MDNRLSQPLHYLHFEPQIFVAGAGLCFAECSVRSLASAQEMPLTDPPQSIRMLRMSPDIATCPLGEHSHSG